MGSSRWWLLFRLIVVVTVVTPVVVLSAQQMAAPLVEGQTADPSDTDDAWVWLPMVLANVPHIGCTDADWDSYAVEGGDCGPVDCDDTDPAVHPGAVEVCDNGIDDDCDGDSDAADPDCLTCTDADGDGYALEGGDCGLVDCDDTDPAVYPGATEVCDNGIDDDCDGATDAADPDCAVCTDADGDGYAIEGGDCGLVDCDDTDPAVYPGATEVCDNGIDDDCDGATDAADPDCPACTDADGDGYALEGGDCGLVDCDDTNPDVYPGATEVCSNGIDDDCDGDTDVADSDCEPWCADSDGGLNYEVAGYVEGLDAGGLPYLKYDFCETGTYDGYVREYFCNGPTAVGRRYQCPYGCADNACLTSPPECTDADGDSYAVEGGYCGPVDCDDTNPAVHPGAVEVCDNGIDDDCDGFTDMADPACGSCTDSDGGFKYFRPGTVVDRNEQVYTDECTATPGEVREYACGLEGEAQIQTYLCPNGCADGACVDPNIVVIGWDGAQRDHFRQCFFRQLPECSQGLPNIEALDGGVVLNTTTTSGATSTKPGWVQIFTGYNAEVTGVYDLGEYQPIPEGYTTFEKIENHFGADNVVTMFISAKGVHTGGACVGEWTYCNGVPCIEELGQPWCLTKFHLDYFELDQNQNDAIGNRALQLLETHQHDLFFALFLFRDPDITGHLYSEDSAEYSNAIIAVDNWLDTIVAKLHELGIYDRTLVYVTTDHGFDEGRDYHLNAPYGIFATNDPLVRRSGDLKDVGPTFLERYGISRGPIGPAPAVNGYSLYSFPPITCTPEGEAYVDYAGARPCCSGLTVVNLDKKFGVCTPATGGTGDDSGYCTACGNGVCQEPENACNCPADCE